MTLTIHVLGQPGTFSLTVSPADGPVYLVTEHGPSDVSADTSGPDTSPRLALALDADDGTGDGAWEACRRLLCARSARLAEETGLDGDAHRHRAAEAASGGRTASSLRLTGAEMAEAVRHVEARMANVGLDVPALDAEWVATRRAA